jgi:crotonobetainyl-CoA:carnitine CoA-transferase CaiB-like acyl-CoA transferase
MAGRETGMWVVQQTEVALISREREGRGGTVYGAEVYISVTLN